MGITRRQVKHVARLQHKLFVRFKVLQNFQRYALLQGEVFLQPDFPATTATGLKQKHVITVKVRPHAAAWRGKRNHQVVQPGIGHKTKLLQQRMPRRLM